MNINKYHVVKIDSAQNFYLIYLKRGGNYFKVVSEKIEKANNCEKIKKQDYLSLSINLITGNSKIPFKVDGIIYKETAFVFERDSILNIYEADQLTGLCYNKK
ncbi:hypothetical protein [Aequorivita capsosiphonis]|uniref:hypothetical protein n=1 Tax=Aequorivita capsosiphonis TaxID=487317 RepID=UPI00040297CB|nr:hypothetical protein [Aequorivita capsosiphonis]